jgi:hypothetical protein
MDLPCQIDPAGSHVITCSYSPIQPTMSGKMEPGLKEVLRKCTPEEHWLCPARDLRISREAILGRARHWRDLLQSRQPLHCLSLGFFDLPGGHLFGDELRVVL